MAAPAPWEADPTVEAPAAPATAAPADQPWAQDTPIAQTDQTAAAPPTVAPEGAGFTDPEKQQILAYIPHAKNPADLEQFSLQISGGKSKIANAADILAKRDQGAQQFGWAPPKVDASLAPKSPLTIDHVRQAVGDALLNLITPGLGVQSGAAAQDSGAKPLIEHIANAAVADYGPEVGGVIDKILNGGDLGTNVAHERAMLEGDSADHPVASILGELTGAGLTGALGNEAGLANAARGVKIAAGAGAGAAYGSGAAGPGKRVSGGLTGAAIGSATEAAAPLIAKFIAATKSGDTAAAAEAAQAAHDLGIDLPKFVAGREADAQKASALEQTVAGRKPIADATNKMLDQSEAARNAIALDLVASGRAPPGTTAEDIAVHKSEDGSSASVLIHDPASGNIAGSAMLKSADGRTVNVDSVIGAGGANSVGPKNVRELLPLIKIAYPDAEFITGNRITGARQGGLAAAEKRFAAGEISWDELKATKDRLGSFKMKVPEGTLPESANTFDPLSAPGAMGDQALTAAVKANKGRRAAAGRLYDQARSLTDGVTIAPTQTMATVDDLLAQEQAKIGGSKIAPILGDIKADLQRNGSITVDQARDLRTTLRERLTSEAGSTPSNADRLTNQVMGAVNQDMETGLAGKGDAAAVYKQADAAWAQQRSLEDEVLKPFLGKNFDNWGEDVAKKINSDAKGNGTRLAQFLGALPEDAANNVRASLISHLGTATDGAQNAAGDAFSMDRFLTNWNQIKGARNLVFPKDTVQSLDKLAKVAEAVKAAGRTKNRSNTGNVLSYIAANAPMTLGVGETLLTHDPRGLALGFMFKGLSALRQYRAAKLLASPDFARKLAATPLNKAGATAFWSRPWVQAMASKNPAIAAEIRAFQGAFLNAANDNAGTLSPAAAQPQEEEQQ